MSHRSLAGGACAALLILAGTLRPQSIPGDPAPELFRPVPPAEFLGYYEDATAIRQRNVTADLDLFSGDEAPRSGQRILVNLFPDVQATGVFERVEAAWNGYVASYRLEEDPRGGAWFSVSGAAMTASVRLHDRLYKVNHVGGGQLTITESDEFLHQPCGTGREHEISGPVEPRSRSQALHDHTIDVLVVYTDDARAANGGASGIVSLVNLAVFETNQGYANSDVLQRLNLVQAREVAFNEAGGMSTWLNQLTNTADGIIDEVHGWRDFYGADMVSMITNTGDYCGIAWLMTSVGAGFASNAFSVVQDSCATGYYSFGHELGHNLGCAHDRANAGSAAYPYAYGWRTTDNAYRTVMAYSPGTRILYFSNPGKDAPNGLPLGVADPAPNSAENWKCLNNTATTASAWRAYRDYGHRVMTQFASNNGFAGNMFDIQPRDNLTITAMSINTSAAAGTAVSVNVWWRSGSYVGHENSSAGWQLLASGSGTSAGQDNPTYIVLPNARTFSAGSTYGLYVDLSSYGTGQSLRYTNGGPTVYENNHLRLTTGVGKGNPAFTGSTFTYREWNGVLYYRGGDGEFTLETSYASNNQFAGNMFDISPRTDIVVDSFDVNVAAVGTVVTVDVWYRSGSHAGHESDPAGWIYLGSDSKAVAAGQDQPTRIAFGPVTLREGQTYGFYVNLASYESGVQALRYSNGSSSFDNGHLVLSTGVGKGNGSFTGATFTGRTWNGTVHYTIPGPTLQVFNLVSGANATVQVTKCTPLGQVRVSYSFAGGGPTPDPCGTIYLSAPIKNLPVITCNGGGTGSLTAPVGAGLTGRTVWLHGLDISACDRTNPLRMVIQ